MLNSPFGIFGRSGGAAVPQEEQQRGTQSRAVEETTSTAPMERLVMPLVCEEGVAVDLRALIESEEYQDAVFVYSCSVRGMTSAGRGYVRSGWVVRQVNPFGAAQTHPRAVPMPVYDDNGAFSELSPAAEAGIEMSITLLEHVIEKHGYRRVIYFASLETDGEYPLRPFLRVPTSPDVLRYIGRRISRLGRVSPASTLSLEQEPKVYSVPDVNLEVYQAGCAVPNLNVTAAYGEPVATQPPDIAPQSIGFDQVD